MNSKFESVIACMKTSENLRLQKRLKKPLQKEAAEQRMLIKVDLNATQAAIRAGYAINRASEQGHQLLQKTTVSAEIEKEIFGFGWRMGGNSPIFHPSTERKA